MADHVVRPTPEELRSMRRWHLLSLGILCGYAVSVVGALLVAFFRASLEQQRTVVETVVAGLVVLVALVAIVEALTQTGRDR